MKGEKQDAVRYHTRQRNEGVGSGRKGAGESIGMRRGEIKREKAGKQERENERSRGLHGNKKFAHKLDVGERVERGGEGAGREVAGRGRSRDGTKSHNDKRMSSPSSHELGRTGGPDVEGGRGHSVPQCAEFLCCVEGLGLLVVLV